MARTGVAVLMTLCSLALKWQIVLSETDIVGQVNKGVGAFKGQVVLSETDLVGLVNKDADASALMAITGVTKGTEMVEPAGKFEDGGMQPTQIMNFLAEPSSSSGQAKTLKQEANLGVFSSSLGELSVFRGVDCNSKRLHRTTALNAGECQQSLFGTASFKPTGCGKGGAVMVEWFGYSYCEKFPLGREELPTGQCVPVGLISYKVINSKCSDGCGAGIWILVIGGSCCGLCAIAGVVAALLFHRQRRTARASNGLEAR